MEKNRHNGLGTNHKVINLLQALVRGMNGMRRDQGGIRKELEAMHKEQEAMRKEQEAMRKQQEETNRQISGLRQDLNTIFDWQVEHNTEVRAVRGDLYKLALRVNTLERRVDSKR